MSLILVIVLLLIPSSLYAGTTDSRWWFAYCANQPNVKFQWKTGGVMLNSTTNGVKFKAPYGQLVKVWTTDGKKCSTTNSILTR